jgi:hypothetical protein
VTPPRVRPPVPAIALDEPAAAASLSMGVTFFRENVAPELKVIRIGSKRLYPVVELECWAIEHAERTL